MPRSTPIALLALAAACADATGTTAHGVDGDVFDITVPAGPHDGYATVDVTSVEGGTAMVRNFVDGDDSRISSVSSAFEDTDLHAFLSVVAGQTYRFEIVEADGPGDGFSYEVALAFHEVPDPFEPNDSHASALPVGEEPVQAYFHAGYESHVLDDEDYDDWFAFESDGRPFTVALTDVPENIRPAIHVFPDDTDDEDIGDAWSGDEGEDLDLSVSPAAGAWRIRVSAQWDTTAGYGSATLADSYSQPYTLTVRH